MANPFLAEIRIFAGNFAPQGWSLCNGQLLSISQNAALFSLLGTNFGGDGRSNFGLPNLQNNAPMHWGNGAGLTPRVLGEVGGTTSVTLISSQVPQHNHTYTATSGSKGDTNTVAGNVNADEKAPAVAYATAADNTIMNPGMLVATPTGIHDNLQPYLGLNFIIAMRGVYPSRS
jgi:microcystin-dependent protein